MCGIVALLCHANNATSIQTILDGVETILNRGYDSIGLIALSIDEHILIKKVWGEVGSAWPQFKNTVQDNIPLLSQCINFVAHSRWATHGSKTVKNCHPHSDESKKLYLVHNGIIQNYNVLRNIIAAVKLESDTDTEVLVQLVGHYYTQMDSIYDAFVRALGGCEGSWAVIMSTPMQPQSLYIARRDSPLVVGFTEDRLYVASEHHAFPSQVETILIVPEGCIWWIQSKNGVFYVFDGQRERKISDYPCQVKIDIGKRYSNSCAPWTHWTEKEITEQSQSVYNAINRGARLEPDIRLGGLQQQQSKLNTNMDHLIMIACGSSRHAALFALPVFQKLRVFSTVNVIEASEFNSDMIPTRGDTTFIFISQSGETYDCYKALRLVRTCSPDSCCVGVVNTIDSLISRETDCGVYLNAGREVGVASTKCFTSQVVVLTLIALWFAQQQSRVLESLRQELINLHTVFLEYIPKMETIATSLVSLCVSVDHIFILGHGFSNSIAMEGALKIKELSYIHAEGFSAGALKHGPFALLNPGTPVFIHAWQGPHYQQLMSCCQEVHARGALVILVTNQMISDTSFVHKLILIDNNAEYTSALTSSLLYQWLSYKLALYKNIDPDKPRNLAKSVTVE